MHEITFANPLGAWLAPMLLAVRATGFFEYWVYIPVMTAIGVPIYWGLHRRCLRHGGLVAQHRAQRWALHALHLGITLLGANALAVAFKTLIVEEMDYPEPVWFLGLVSPLHFYITSVAAVYLWLVTGPRSSRGLGLQGAYAELGLFAGCTVAIHRLHTEAFSIWAPTMALGGLVILAACVAGMVDVWQRRTAANAAPLA